MSWWSPTLLADLAAHYRVTVFDLPGVGYSGTATGSFTVDWLADVTAGLLDELNLDDAAVLGWGLGAQIAVALAERHPQLVGDLVLADTGLPMPGSHPMPTSASRLLTSLRAGPRAVARALFPVAAVAAAQAWLKSLTAQVPDVVTAQAIRAEEQLESSIWRGGNLVAGLHHLHVPTLVIAGSEDAVFPVADATALHSAIPGAQLYLMPGNSYGAIVQSPTQFVDALRSFTS